MVIVRAKSNGAGLALPKALSAASVGTASLLIALGVALWSSLGAARSIEWEAIDWEEQAEATRNPAPDAPPIYQYSPMAASLVERTFERTTTLPPQFLERIGAEGISVLAPYMTDPSAQNVLRLADTFRRSGQDVVLTRQVTRLEEQPLTFQQSQVNVTFKRLGGRAYEAAFDGRYTFKNPTDKPITGRFTFAPPYAGTLRGLSVTVNGQTIADPSENGNYEWLAEMPPGQEGEARIRYTVRGANTWNYDVGSRRRRVEKFALSLDSNGPLRFQRGSIEPTSTAGDTWRWDLQDVITSQQVAISFPPEVASREGFLQALRVFPAAFVFFVLGSVVLSLGTGWSPARMALAMLWFALGLIGATILSHYAGPAVALLTAPILGAFAASFTWGKRTLPAALGAALLPATFLSPEHTGPLAFALGVVLLCFANWSFSARRIQSAA